MEHRCQERGSAALHSSVRPEPLLGCYCRRHWRRYCAGDVAIDTAVIVSRCVEVRAAGQVQLIGEVEVEVPTAICVLEVDIVATRVKFGISTYIECPGSRDLPLASTKKFRPG